MAALQAIAFISWRSLLLAGDRLKISINTESGIAVLALDVRF